MVQRKTKKQLKMQAKRDAFSAVNTNSQAAKQCAFRTPELLEHILSFVDLKDVLRANQVCRVFKATIENSPNLQKKLYLLKDSIVKPAYWTMLGKDHTITEFASRPQAVPSHTTRLGYRYLFNPLLLMAYETEERFVEGSRIHLTATTMHLVPDMSSADITAVAVGLSDSSCWEMFLTKPPIAKVVVKVRYVDSEQDPHSRGMTVLNSEGVRLGDVVCAIERRIGDPMAELLHVFVSGQPRREVAFVSEEELEMVERGAWYPRWRP